MRNKLLIKYIKMGCPQGVIIILLQYFLGVSLATYFGKHITTNLLVLGGGWLISLYFGSIYMLVYFDNLDYRYSKFWGDTQGKIPIQLPLLTSAGFLTSVIMLSIAIFRSRTLSGNMIFILILIIVLDLLIIFPNLPLSMSLFNEFISSVLLAVLVPLFGFLLFNDSISFSVVAIVFPSFFTLFSLFIVFELFNFKTVIQTEKNNLLTILGWELGLKIHNALYGMAFLWILIWIFLDLPFNLVISMLLLLPLILLQFWLLKQLKKGNKPKWNIIKVNSITIYSLMNYMIMIYIWTN